jgi:hypothetical protein
MSRRWRAKALRTASCGTWTRFVGLEEVVRVPRGQASLATRNRIVMRVEAGPVQRGPLRDAPEPLCDVRRTGSMRRPNRIHEAHEPVRVSREAVPATRRTACYHATNRLLPRDEPLATTRRAGSSHTTTRVVSANGRPSSLANPLTQGDEPIAGGRGLASHRLTMRLHEHGARETGRRGGGKGSASSMSSRLRSILQGAPASRRGACSLPRRHVVSTSAVAEPSWNAACSCLR